MSEAPVLTESSLRVVDLLSHALRKWGIELTEAEGQAFALYAEMLVEWNRTRFNLTRLTTPDQIALSHFLDSLVLTQILKIPAKASMIDVGTGPGFPGLAFKVLRPDVKLTLIESTAKKLMFCQAVSDALNMSGVHFVHGRSEELSTIKRYGRTATVVTARAVAPLKTLLEWTAPLVAPNGTIVAWKGSKVYDEVAEARQTADRLGLKLEVVERTLSLENTEPVVHYYVICRAR